MIVRSRSALGLKYLRDHTGNSEPGLPGGLDPAASAAPPEPVEIDQVLNTFDEPTRRAIQENLVEFGDALAGRGPDLNAALGELQPLLDRSSSPWRGTSPPRSTGLGPFFTRPRPRPPRWRRWPRPRRRCSSTSTPRSAPSPGRAAVHPGDDLRDPADPGHADADRAADQDASSATARTLFADLQPGRQGAERELADDRLGARDRAPRSCRAPRSSTPSSPPTARTLCGVLTRTRASAAASSARRSSSAARRRRSGSSTPAQSVCNYATLLLRNAQSLLSLGDGDRQLAAVPGHGGGQINPFSGTRTRRTARTAPPRHRPTARRVSTRNELPPRPTPIRTPPRPGQPHVCAAGNEKYIAEQGRDRQPAPAPDQHRGDQLLGPIGNEPRCVESAAP